MASKKRQAKKVVKFAKKNPKLFVALVVVLIVGFIVYCYLNPDFYNNLFNQNNIKPPADNEVTTVSVLNDLEIHIIDIGQGDAILIKAPDGKNIMFDAGENGTKYETILSNYFEAHNINTIDYFIATHTDSDHIGSADHLFNITNVKKVFRPYIKHVNSTSTIFEFTNEFNMGSFSHGTNKYGEFLECILNEKYGNNIKCLWEFFTSDSDFANSAKYNDVEYKYTFDFLTPTASLSNVKYNNVNNYSPIVMLEYCGFKMIFTGDAEEEVEEEFISKYKTYTNYVDCDVLKVGHHGSRWSTTKDFLDLIKPESAVISCGTNNDYSHPHTETLNRLIGTSLYRTDTNGHIVIKVNSEGNFTLSLQNNNLLNNFTAPPEKK